MKRRTAERSGTGSPTLEDVARAAGVSTATVSRCLNTPDRVVEDTRRRVLGVVSELGYAPNFGARALAACRTNTIGAIIPTMENAIFARGLQAFQEELARHGLTLLVASSSYRTDLEEEQIRTLLARGADALLLIGFSRSDTAYDIIERRGVPVVVAWAYSQHAKQVSIGFNNRKAMRALARKVIAKGHRRLAVITAPQSSNDRARDRVAGILDAAREAGIPEGQIPILETPYSIDNGARAMRDLLDQHEGITAVMCGNDVLAVGALRMAQSLGLGVPENISITGFDDIEIAGIVAPALTTVHVPHREMGREAARLISGLLDGGKALESVELRTRIVERNSLGPAPSVN